MKKNPKVSIQITGGGSGTGIAALLNGTAMLANISRELKDGEIEHARELNVEPMKFRVALDGIALIVNPSNPIDSLTLIQIRKIFSGELNNWMELGGEDRRIVLYGRENSSGTYEYFRQTVLGTANGNQQLDFATSTQVLQGTAALGEAVSHDRSGIGYGGVGYFANRKDLKILSIKKDNNALPISPIESDNNLNYEAIYNGDYSLSRFLYCYTNGTPSGEIKEFLDFILSEEGQKIVAEMEYIPLLDYQNQL